MSRNAHDHLRYAQALLGHQVAPGDIAAVIERSLVAFVAQLETRKFAATARPRRCRPRGRANPRHIPAHVRRAVWERDGGQCTFVNEAGMRCPARKALEFDHIQAVARGGEATVDGIRLLCRAHNQYAAERTFGPEFMRHQRIAAAGARAEAKAHAAAPARAGRAPVVDQDRDVVPWLRALGFSAAEAHRAAARCADMADASLEERVRIALSCFRVRGTRCVPVPADVGVAAGSSA